MALTKATNRMTSGAVANVLDFGAIGDGTTDDAAAIQAAIDSLATTGGVVSIPTGTYKVATGLNLAASNVKIDGAGWKATNIVLYSDAAGFNVTGSYCELEGFQMTKSGTHTTNGVTVGSATGYAERFRIREVFINGMGNHGVEVIASALMYIEDVTSINNGSDGIHISATYQPNVQINSGGVIDVRGNRHGVYIQADRPGGKFSSAHNFGTIVSQSNSGDGIKLECDASNFTGVYTENNTGAGLNLVSNANGNRVHILNGGITNNGSGNMIFHEDIESEKAGLQFLELSGNPTTGGWKVNSAAGSVLGSMTFRHTAGREFSFTAADSDADFTVKYVPMPGRTIHIETDGHIFATGQLKGNRLNISSIPTSATGLLSGDVWSNSGVLTIVT